MKEAVTEHLGEKDLHAPGGQLRNVHVCVLERLNIADRRPAYPFHDQDLGSAVVPVHRRHMDDFGIGKAPLEPGRIGALTAQVHLESQGPLVLLHDFDQV